MTSEADFAEHYRNNYRRVLGLCRRLLGRLYPAEDAAQEVFLRAHRALASYDPARPFESWILTLGRLLLTALGLLACSQIGQIGVN